MCHMPLYGLHLCAAIGGYIACKLRESYKNDYFRHLLVPEMQYRQRCVQCRIHIPKQRGSCIPLAPLKT